jgi:hypothetical protein
MLGRKIKSSRPPGQYSDSLSKKKKKEVKRKSCPQHTFIRIFIAPLFIIAINYRGCPQIIQ